jgi:hypothetical protein
MYYICDKKMYNVNLILSIALLMLSPLERAGLPQAYYR